MQFLLRIKVKLIMRIIQVLFILNKIIFIKFDLHLIFLDLIYI